MKPAINSRSSWAVGRPPLGPLEAEDVRFLIVHHSASFAEHTTRQAPEIIRSFYDFHTGPRRGWADVAYNFLIDADGIIWEGRAGSLDGPVRGDATGGNQGFTQLVCVIGDYEQEQPSDASRESLIALLAWLADRYSIATDPGARVTFESRGSNRWREGITVTTPTIVGHRAMSITQCPGDRLNAFVEGGLMAAVTALAQSSELELPASLDGVETAAAAAPTVSTAAVTVPPTSRVVSATEKIPVEKGDAPVWMVPIGATALLGLVAWRLRRMRGS